jgi:hypothetical protein
VERRRLLKLAAREFRYSFPNAPESGVSCFLMNVLFILSNVSHISLIQKKVISRAMAVLRQRRAASRRSPRKYLQRISTPCSSLQAPSINPPNSSNMSNEEIQSRIEVREDNHKKLTIIATIFSKSSLTVYIRVVLPYT